MGIKKWLSRVFKKENKEGIEEKHEKEKEKDTHTCALCGCGGARKKFAGSWWHKKCLRKARRDAKRRI